MNGTQPITDAVYGRRSSVRKPAKPSRRPVQSLVGGVLGEDAVAELYAGLGMKQPSQRRKRGGRR